MFPLYPPGASVRNDARDPSSKRWNGRRERCPVVILSEFWHPRKFRDLLRAANLRHGTDGFTSPPRKVFPVTLTYIVPFFPPPPPHPMIFLSVCECIIVQELYRSLLKDQVQTHYFILSALFIFFCLCFVWFIDQWLVCPHVHWDTFPLLVLQFFVNLFVRHRNNT